MYYRLTFCAVLLALVSSFARSADTFDSAGAQAAEMQREYDSLKKDIANRKWFDKIAKQTLRSESLIAESDRDPADVVLRRTEALLKHLGALDKPPKLDAEAAQLAALKAKLAKTPAKDAEARRERYQELCKLRRKIALANPLLNFDKITFLTHNMAYYGHICDQYIGHNQRPGGGLYVLQDPFGDKPKVRDLLDGVTVAGGSMKGKKLSGGSFISLELSFDAKTILFAWTQAAAPEGLHKKWPVIKTDCYKELWTPEAAFHIFSLDLEKQRLVQLTEGRHSDFDPCFLPGGRIAFISERRGGYGRCHPRPVPTYTLYSMKADGSDIIPLSYHETNEWHPSVGNDGMIIYSRWDYVDRDSDVAHHIWVTYPDGRDPRNYHGNYPKRRESRPWAEQSIRAVPGSKRFIGLATAHHGQNYGPIIRIDHQVPDDGACSQVRRVTPETPFPEAARRKRDPAAQRYSTPWPLSEDFYLCVYDSQGKHFRLCLVDSFGNRELLYCDDKVPCLDPIPLRRRATPPILRPRTTAAIEDRKANGDAKATIFVLNVYDAELPLPKDTVIKEMRIIELFPKTTPMVGSPRIGIAAQSLARGVLGTVPVESDGSAYCQAPVGVPVYFQLLDENGCAVQTMRSDTYVHRGEQMACQGCHEAKMLAHSNRRRNPLALKRAASKIKPEMSGSNPVLFPVLVQPVLDKKCIPCHTKEKAKGKKTPDLRGDKFVGSGWSQAYSTLSRYSWYKSGGNGAIRQNKTSFSIPGQIGAQGSKLYPMLKKGHNKVKLTPAELRRITLWLDCNSVFYGSYHETKRQARGEVIVPKPSDQYK